MLVVALVVLVAVGHAAWWAWALLLLAAAGVWQTLWLCRHISHGTSPRDPLVRWAWRSSVDSQGQHGVNVSGVLEGVASLGLAFIGPFAFVEGEIALRLLCFTGAVLYASSNFSGVFLDIAFYNPAEPAPRALEFLRAIGGFLLAGLTVAIAAPASWPPTAVPIVAVICALPLLIQLRVRETDRLMVYGARQAKDVRLLGRSDVVQAAHSSLSTPLNEAVRRARTRVAADPDAYDLMRLIRSRFQEITAMEIAIEVDIDWPGVLTRPIEALCRPLGVNPQIVVEAHELIGEHRDIARWVLGDLVGNAVDAGAEQVSIVIAETDSGETVSIAVTDDAPPFPPGCWALPTGGLARLRARLERHGGQLHLEDPVDAPKTVTATWHRPLQSEKRMIGGRS